MQIDMMKNDRAKVFRPPPLHYNPPILPHPCFCQSSNLKKSKMQFEWAYHNTILFLFLGTRGLDGKQIPLLLKRLETLWGALLLIGLGFGIPSKPPEIHPRCNSGALEHSNFQLGPCQRLLAPQVHLPPHFLFHRWAFNRACTLLHFGELADGKAGQTFQSVCGHIFQQMHTPSLSSPHALTAWETLHNRPLFILSIYKEQVKGKMTLSNWIWIKNIKFDEKAKTGLIM